MYVYTCVYIYINIYFEIKAKQNRCDGACDMDRQ